jgi:hypothetical protein
LPRRFWHRTAFLRAAFGNAARVDQSLAEHREREDLHPTAKKRVSNFNSMRSRHITITRGFRAINFHAKPSFDISVKPVLLRGQKHTYSEIATQGINVHCFQSNTIHFLFHSDLCIQKTLHATVHLFQVFFVNCQLKDTAAIAEMDACINVL